MAQLKDLIVNGPTRLIGPAYGKISSADTVPVVNSNANLQFGQSTTIATIAGVAVNASLPAGGYQGPKGTDGTNGAQGRQGPKGTDATGVQGPAGTNGTNGTNGAQGRQGPKGTDATGSQGPKGDQGPAGGGGGSAISVKASTGSTACYLLGINSTTATGTGVELTSSNVFRAGNGSSNGVWFASKNLYASSDERLKDFKGDIDIDFEKLSTIPKKYFTWKEDGPEGSVNIGTSAQKLKEVYPSLVMGDDNDYYGVAYDKLSIVALAAIDKLHEENLELKNEIAELKEEIKRLGLNNQIYG